MISYEKIPYKYRLTKDATAVYSELAGFTVHHAFFTLLNGVLTGLTGYMWDGPSGPTIDTENSLEGSLFHDIGYQMIREGLLPSSTRKIFDDVFYEHLRKNGMSWPRAQAWYWSVRMFGAKHTRKER